MIQREEYLKSSKSQHCHSTKLTVHPSSQLYCVFISANCCYCSSIGIIYCIVGILAVLCLHPSSQLYCVFISANCSPFLSAALCLHLCQLLLVLFNWKDLLQCWDLGCTVSSSLPIVAGVLQLEGSNGLFGIANGAHCWIEASSFACMTLLSIYWYILCMVLA